MHMVQGLIKLHTLSTQSLQRPLKDSSRNHLLSLDALLDANLLLKKSVFDNAQQSSQQILSTIKSCSAHRMAQEILTAVTVSQEAGDEFIQQRHQARESRVNSALGDLKRHAAQQEKMYKEAEAQYQLSLSKSQATLRQIEQYTASLLCLTSELEQVHEYCPQGQESAHQVARAFATQAWRLGASLPLNINLGRWGLAASALLVQLHDIQVHFLRHSSAVTLLCEGCILWTSEDPTPKAAIKLNANAASRNWKWREVPAATQPSTIFLLQTDPSCKVWISIRRQDVRPGYTSQGPESEAQSIDLDQSRRDIQWSAAFYLPCGRRAALTGKTKSMYGLKRTQPNEETEGIASPCFWYLNMMDHVDTVS